MLHQVLVLGSSGNVGRDAIDLLNLPMVLTCLALDSLSLGHEGCLAGT